MSGELYIPEKGRNLLAKTVTSKALVLTRMMVGSGQIAESFDRDTLTDLLYPVAEATSTTPETVENRVEFEIEYRNDMNGGLTEGFDIWEFGVFAQDPEEGEVLLLYGSLTQAQGVAPDTGGILDTRRFPVYIAVVGDITVETLYTPTAYATKEDIDTHNSSLSAHSELFAERMQLRVSETRPTELGIFLWIDQVPEGYAEVATTSIAEISMVSEAESANISESPSLFTYNSIKTAQKEMEE